MVTQDSGTRARGRPVLAVAATVLIVVLLAASSPAQEAPRSGRFLRVQWHVIELRGDEALAVIKSTEVMLQKS